MDIIYKQVRWKQVKTVQDAKKFQIIISRSTLDPEWDQFVEHASYGQYSQTSLWAQVKSVQGWQPVRILIKDTDRIVAGVQILTKMLPFGGRIGAIWRGPLIETSNSELDSVLWQTLVRLCWRSRIYYLALDLPADDDSLIHSARIYGFREALLGDIDTRAEVVLDLSPELDEIFHHISKNRRKLIHRGEARGVCVREGDERDVVLFHQLHAHSAKRLGFVPYQLEFFEKLWQLFAPSQHIKLFIAEYQGQPLSAQINLLFRDTMTAYKIGWSGEHPDLYPNDEIHWHAIQWAKLHGFRWFNLMGIETPVAEALRHGHPIPDEYLHTYNSYKLSFSSQLVFYPPTYERVFLPGVSWLYWKFFPRFKEVALVKRAIKSLRGVSAAE